MRMTKRISGALLAAALLGAAGLGHAQSVRATSSDSFEVRIIITGDCEAVVADDIEFDTQPQATATTLTKTGNITVKCSLGLPFRLGIDGGEANDVSARQMSGPRPGVGTKIPYSLARTATDGDHWGVTENTNDVGGTGAGKTSPLEFKVYAKTTLTGNEPVGTYTDTVNAILTY